MKKIRNIVLIVILLIFAGVFVWYITPKRLCRIDVDKVEKIEIFDGNLGVEVEITKESDIERLMDSWRAVCMKKEKSSEGYIGMGMRTCIYLKNGDVEKFDIRSEDKVEKDGFFYEVVSGSTEYDYIRELTKAQDVSDEQR